VRSRSCLGRRHAGGAARLTAAQLDSWQQVERRIEAIAKGASVHEANAADKTLAALGMIEDGGLSAPAMAYYHATYVFHDKAQAAEALAVIVKTEPTR
jgi:hypothetical protein